MRLSVHSLCIDVAAGRQRSCDYAFIACAYILQMHIKGIAAAFVSAISDCSICANSSSPQTVFETVFIVTVLFVTAGLDGSHRPSNEHTAVSANSDINLANYQGECSHTVRRNSRRSTPQCSKESSEERSWGSDR
jgi:hypothetical protein